MPVRLRADVSLGPVTRACAARMLAWMRNPEMSEAIGLSRSPTIEQTLAWIETTEKDVNISAWAIVAGGNHVGNVVLDQYDKKAQTARLSMYIGERDARSQGVGTTAIYEALERAYREKQLFKVWLTVHSENAAAIRVYAKCGFQVEGTLRQAFVLSGRRLDALYMGLLATEFSKIEVER
jgi:RimJ/RimL family protein N-acetyltransferase